VGNQWMAVFGGTNYWAPLRTRLTSSVAGLFVKDFNGDGLADITRNSSVPLVGGVLQVSFGGIGNWTTLRTGSFMAFGRFDGARGADALLWASGNVLHLASGGAGALQEHSRQDMR
jgi:hypothetical protein